MQYPGGKNAPGVYQRIINLMPPHRRYFELFLGSGAVMRNKRPAELLNVGVDLSLGAVRAVAGAFSNLVGSSRVAMVDPPATSGRARFGGVGRNGARLDPASPGGARRIELESLRLPVAAAIANSSARFEFVHGDAIEYLRRRKFEPTDLVYCDPPYLMETRSGRRIYEHEFTALQHRSLLRLLQDLPCAVIVSGYDSPLYQGLVDVGWWSAEYDVMTRGGAKRERVWCNFRPAAARHDYRFLGADYRDRERIQRKMRRWLGKWQALPRVDRLAVLFEIACLGIGFRTREQVERRRLRWKRRLERLPAAERQALLLKVSGLSGFGDASSSL